MYNIYTLMTRKSVDIPLQQRPRHYFFLGFKGIGQREMKVRDKKQPNKVNIAVRKMLFMFNEGMKKRNTS
jgi:hypothetical protein